MGAAVLEGRQDHLDRLAPGLLLVPALARAHQPHVVGVRDGDVADAAQDVLGAVAVAAARLAGKVRLEAGQPFLGRRRVVMRHEGREQRRVVGVLARADADPPLPFGVRQILVGDRVKLQVLGRIDDARAHRQGEPLVARVAQVFRDGGGQDLGFDRLGQAPFHQIDEVAGVHRHQHVGGRAFAFRGKALDQAVLQEDRVDLDAGVFGEGLQKRLDQSRFARGVKVQFLGGSTRAGEDGGACQNGAHDGRVGFHDDLNPCGETSGRLIPQRRAVSLYFPSGLLRGHSPPARHRRRHGSRPRSAAG